MSSRKLPTYLVSKDHGNGRVTITQLVGNQRVHIAHVYDPRDAQRIADALNGVTIMIDYKLGQVHQIVADAELPQVKLYLVETCQFGKLPVDFKLRWFRNLIGVMVTRVYPVVDCIAETFAAAAFLAANRRRKIRWTEPGKHDQRFHVEPR